MSAPDRASPGSPRVVLVTDTLADVNGVSRFIRSVAERARARGHELHVVTSTPLECPAAPNIHNVPPRYARAMPRYPQLRLSFPHGARMRALLRELRPDAVHVSTPGPVGAAGRRAALRAGLPLLGTYHTDFPAYVEHLLPVPGARALCTTTMARFYRPFARVFTRSIEYGEIVAGLGVPRARIVRLLPGIDTSAFSPRFRDASGALWNGHPSVRPGAVKALYVGRVSVEKNLPLLTRAWPAARDAARARGVDAQLLIVGDGPYRAEMERALGAGGPEARDASAAFLGFRHGPELSAIYASCDLFLFPSKTDTLGQVVMEAQSAGLPVVVTDRGGPAGVVDAGSTGLVIPADPPATEPERWSCAIVELLTDAERRRQMGAAAHAKIAPLTIDESFEHFWSEHVAAARELRAGERGA